MKRTDPHCPSNLIPADYEYIGYLYTGPESVTYEGGGHKHVIHDDTRYINMHMEKTNGSVFGGEHQCAMCGQITCFHWGVFYHAKSNEYIWLGHICASSVNSAASDTILRNTKKQNDAIKRVSRIRNAEQVLADNGLEACWNHYDPANEDDDTCHIIADIVRKLVRYGEISDAQINFLGTLLKQWDERLIREQRIADEKAAADPIPNFKGRTTIVGKVVSKKFNEDWCKWNMVVKSNEGGWCVWGTAPTNVIETLAVGDEIQFDAAITVSDKDEKFGFFKRPTKAGVFQHPMPAHGITNN